MEREGQIIKPLPIVALGNEILRAKTIPVESVEVAKDIVAKLKATLVQVTTGVGLAAPQINSNLSAFIMKNGGRGSIIAVINPQIIKRADTMVTEEGCLSIPNVYGEVPMRDKSIEVVFYDENLKRHRMKFSDFAGNIFQHEYDHLQGILFIDRMTKEGREKIADDLSKIEQGKIEIYYDMIFSQPSPQKTASEA